MTKTRHRHQPTVKSDVAQRFLKKMAGISPGHFHFALGPALPRRRGAGRGRRQRCRSAVEQRRDAADGDAPVDAARSVGLFFQILRAVALRSQVFRRHPVLLGQQFGVPAENLTSQGYGSQYLKEQTDGPSRINRRVTVRRITPLLNGGVASLPPPPPGTIPPR